MQTRRRLCYLFILSAGGGAALRAGEAESTKRAATPGRAEAQFDFRLAHNNRSEGMPRDLATAVEWWQKAADQEGGAQESLGRAYARGEEVPKDVAGAWERWRKAQSDKTVNAAVSGDAEAQYELGFAYYWGLRGMPEDAVKAAEWWRKAADQGHLGAQDRLGRAYDSGEGVPKDTVKAVQWWSKAAEQGHSSAQFHLSMAYALGKGVPRDQVLAYAWANLAAAVPRGDEAATKLRDTLLELTPDELAEAQRLSSTWKPGQSLVRERR